MIYVNLLGGVSGKFPPFPPVDLHAIQATKSEARMDEGFITDVKRRRLESVLRFFPGVFFLQEPKWMAGEACNKRDLSTQTAITQMFHVVSNRLIACVWA